MDGNILWFNIVILQLGPDIVRIVCDWSDCYTHLKTVINQKVRSTCPQYKQGPQQLPSILMLKSCAMIIKLKCFWSHLVDYTKGACIGTWKHSYWATMPARGQDVPWTWRSHYLFHSIAVKNILKTVLLLTCNNIIGWIWKGCRNFI